jgi:hypothetical protein
MRTVIGAIVLAGAMLGTSVAGAVPVARPVSAKPTTAPSISTRHVAHETAVHHHRHARLHHIEPNLRAHVVTAASLPARVPARQRVPRSNHRTPATVRSHRDVGSRTSSTAGLPVSTAGALSIAILGTCVHQRTRDRLRSISGPLESRGPPRAGPTATFPAPASRARREPAAGATAPHPPLRGSLLSRVNPSPLCVRQQLAPPPPARVPLERPFPAARATGPCARPIAPFLTLYGGPCPTRSARSRADASRCRTLEPEEFR